MASVGDSTGNTSIFDAADFAGCHLLRAIAVTPVMTGHTVVIRGAEDYGDVLILFPDAEILVSSGKIIAMVPSTNPSDPGYWTLRIEGIDREKFVGISGVNNVMLEADQMACR